MRQRRPAFAGGDVLDRMERENRDVAIGAAADRGPAIVVALIARAERVAGILDDGEAFVTRASGDGFEIGALPGEIDREDRRGALAGRFTFASAASNCGELHQPAVGIAIGENDFRAGEPRRVGGGGKSHGRHDDRVVGADAEREAGEMEGGRAVGATDRVIGAASLGERGFEVAHRGAGGQPIAAQHLDHRGDVVFVDGLPAVGKEPDRHDVSVRFRDQRLQPRGVEPVGVGVAGVAEALGHRRRAGRGVAVALPPGEAPAR